MLLSFYDHKKNNKRILVESLSQKLLRLGYECRERE
mgnify:FL=1